MTNNLAAEKLIGIANSGKNNLNHQDRVFLKQIAQELMSKNEVIQSGKNNVSMINAGTMTINVR